MAARRKLRPPFPLRGVVDIEAVDTAVKYHPVTTALSEAQAAAWLLDELQWGSLASELGVGAVPVQPDPMMPLPPKEIREWVILMASHTLREALARAKREFTKSQAPTPKEAGA